MSKTITSKTIIYQTINEMMDYTKTPRSLIYKDRTDLGDFGIDDESSLMGQFCNNMLDQTFMSKQENSAEILLAVFNNAFYICTLISIEKRPRIYLPQYMAIASNNYKDKDWEYYIMPTTMALVYSLLICSGNFSEKDKFMLSISDYFLNTDLYGNTEGHDIFFNQVFTLNKIKTLVSQKNPECRMPMVHEIPFKIEAREIPTLFFIESHVKTWDLVYGIEYILHETLDSRYDEDDRYWMWDLLGGYVKSFLDEARFSDNKNNKRIGFQAILKLQEAYKKAGLKWTPLYSNNNSSNQDSDQVEMKDKTAEVEEISEDAQMKTRIQELTAENERLKEQLEQKSSAVESEEELNVLKNEINQLRKKHEEMIMELLLPIFYGTEQDVREFLKVIANRRDSEITDTVVEWVKAHKISDKSKGRPLWSVLHAAKYYNSTESNWNTAIKMRR